jgi:hypothetical protein
MNRKQHSMSNRHSKQERRKEKRNNRPKNPVNKQPKVHASFNGLQESWAPVFPVRTTRKLRYSTAVAVSTPSGTIGGYNFSANGLFDPDITSTGHQPMGFDQLMLSYNHYCVLTARISVNFKNQTAATRPAVCLRVSPDTSFPSQSGDLIEYGLFNSEALEGKGVYGSMKRITESVSIKRIQGVDDVLDVAVLQGNAAANPVEQTYFQLLVWDSNGDTSSVGCDVVIEYTATFLEPRLLTPSQAALLRRAFSDPRSLGPPHEAKGWGLFK